MPSRQVWFAGTPPVQHADLIPGVLEAAVLSGGPTGRMLHFHWRDPADQAGHSWIAQIPLVRDDTPTAVPAAGTLPTAEGRWQTLIDLEKAK